MKHPYIANGEAWAMSLRMLMGYPTFEPACHTMAWASGTSRNMFQAMQVTQIAQDMARDLVFLAFADIVPGAPVAVSLAVRQSVGVEWIATCSLYAASETAKIELLGGGRRWHIGPRLVLISQKLPPKGRRAQGEEIALRRWRQMAATMKPLDLVGSVFVGPGKTFADAVPTADIKLAA
ncbi:MAG TPA: hypothetical protein VF637_01285 [Sphingomicrobium sp.]|jgi:hypothetical protein